MTSYMSSVGAPVTRAAVRSPSRRPTAETSAWRAATAPEGSSFPTNQASACHRPSAPCYYDGEIYHPNDRLLRLPHHMLLRERRNAMQL
ncbi:hypothetical protein SKAU_G00027480 [Synaphobranchus kaupii]|uniref:Uncharacterized protein n=1 Tax=Synaphobranchus kaupii TaxID=118154 RepID=A0A9Q1GEC0_SYNKA|nr:hypothetical protein SKAU_G00027480 [Synaphobranchus kaupii]